MRIREWVGVGLSGLMFSSVGCGQSESDGPATVSDFASAAAQTFCDSLGGCCDAADLTFDSPSCRSQTQARFVAVWTSNENAAYDPRAGRACLAQLERNVVCGQASDDEGALSACDHVFVGTVPVGGRCRTSSECKRDGFRVVTCEVGDGAGNGVCTVADSVPAVRGKLGEACDTTCDDDEECLYVTPATGGEPAEYVACYTKDGLHCSFGADATCQPLAAVGMPCDDSDACVGGAYCDFSHAQCRQPQANGASCSDRRDCESRYCDYDEAAGTGTCAEPTVPATACADPDFD